MENIKRRAAVTALLLALASISLVQAQENDAIMVTGSRIVNALVAELADQAGSAEIVFDTTGTAAGIDQFCNGDIDLATATRQITAAERAICSANDVVHNEFLLAHHIVAFIAHPDARMACLDASTLEAMLKPTSSNNVKDWSFYPDQDADLLLTLILPADDQVDYAIVDGLVVGDGLRRDVLTYADTADAVRLTAETAGALAFLPWQASLEDNESIRLLEFRGDDLGACASPAAESVESDEYSAALSLYIYLNRARLDANPALRPLMQRLIGDGNAAALPAIGLTPATALAYRLNADILADVAAASAAAGGFVAPDELSGVVKIVGAALAHPVLQPVADQLSGRNESLEFNFVYAGTKAGGTSFCLGEADMVIVDAPLLTLEDSLGDCAANEIAMTPLPLGSQATVVLAHAADAFAACLTPPQINAIWRGDSTELTKNWSAIDSEFPEQPLTLFGLTTMDQHTDILLQTAGPIIPPIRRDTEQAFDPLYRAAAVGNVTGSLTYMSWLDYQRVLASDQANIQLVAVDDGDGCVVPSPTSIADGSYPLSRRASLLVHQEAMADINIQSFLWTLLDELNWSMVEDEGFIGVTALELPPARRDLQRAFMAAMAKFPPPAEAAGAVPEDAGNGSEADSE